MSDLVLPLMLMIPLVAAVLCAVVGGRAARGVALLAAVANIGVGIYAATVFSWNLPGVQLESSWGSFEPIGFSISLGADSLSLLLAIVTSILTACALFAGDPPSAPGREGKDSGAYYGWLMVLTGALTGVWLARDLLLFYAFFELILVPLFFLIGTFGGADRRDAAAKIFIYTFAGSILALPAILYVGFKVGTFDIADAAIKAQEVLSDTERFWVLLGLLASFCVKTPVFPLHTWQPSAMAESPGNGVVDCVGLVLKLGAYAILKIALPIGLLDASGQVAFPGVLTGLGVLATVGIVYGALCAWVQTDMKRLLAYSSLSHVGFVVLGIVALTEIGHKGAGLYLINTAITTGALFLLVGMIYRRTGTRDMGELSGLGKKMPLLAFFFGLFTMAAIGLPLLNGFVSEFLTIMAAFTSPHLGWAFGAIAATGIVLGAIYMLSMMARVMFGPVRLPADRGDVKDLGAREVTALVPLALLVVVLGVFPKPVLDALGGATGTTVRKAFVQTDALKAPGMVSAATPRRTQRTETPAEAAIDASNDPARPAAR